MSALPLNPLELALVPDVRAAAGGDRTAFGRIVARTRGLVCAITLSRLGNVADSEEIAQDVFLSAWSGLGKLRDPGSFLPWLRQLARNQAVEAHRRRGRAARVLVSGVDATVVADEAKNPSDALSRAQDEAILSDAIAHLGDEDRELLTLFYREGQSIAQVAELLGIREEAARKRLSRARAALREDLAARFGDWLAASAPGERFSAIVLAALPAGAPGAGAALAGKSWLGKLAALGGGAFVGGAFGLAGVWLGLLPVARRIRYEEDRAALRPFRAAGTALVLFMVAGFVVFGALSPNPTAEVTCWIVFAGGMTWLYRGWLPRILARTRAAEAAEDPTAAARHRREEIRSWLGLAFGLVTGSLGLLYGLRH